MARPRKIEAPAVSVRAHDYRCKSCGRLLFRAILPIGAKVQIRCWKHQCGCMNIVTGDLTAIENCANIEAIEYQSAPEASA